MNTDTGEIYKVGQAIAAALAAGLPVVPISDRVARLVRAGRRAEAKAQAKRKRKQAKQSRRANRGR